MRDYLELEFQAVAAPFPLDMERVVDDFVLFCMLIGNDFMPCVPAPSPLLAPAPWVEFETGAFMMYKPPMHRPAAMLPRCSHYRKVSSCWL